MKFTALIKEIKQIRKSNDIDMECSIRFITEDPKIMALAAIPSDTAVEVEVKEEV